MAKKSFKSATDELFNPAEAFITDSNEIKHKEGIKASEAGINEDKVNFKLSKREKKTERIQLAVTPATKKKIYKIAKQNKISVNELCNQLFGMLED